MRYYLASSDDTRSAIPPNRNHPTGTMLRPHEITQLLEKTALHDVLLVLNEAYIEFSDETTSIKHIQNYPNLRVLRTFSKAWGLAGLQLGFLATSEDACPATEDSQNITEYQFGRNQSPKLSDRQLCLGQRICQ